MGWNPSGGGGGGGGSLASLLATSTDAGAHKITNLTDPTSAQDASTKAYVDAQAQTSVLGALASSVLAGATSITLAAAPAVDPSKRGYLVVDAWTTEAEIVRPTALFSGSSLTVPPLANAHSAGAVILWVFSLDRLDVGWFGAAGDGSTDDTTALQNALLAAHAVAGASRVYVPGRFTCKFTSQLTVYSGTSFEGDAVEGQLAVSQLNYYGPDGVDAIVPASGCSKVRLKGLRIEDHRTSPTSGDGWHGATTNGLEIEDCGVFYFPKNGIYIGGTSGTPDNYTIRNIWGECGQYLVYCERITETCLLEQIKGSAATSTSTMQALVYLDGNPGIPSTIRIKGAKVESVYTGLGTHVVQVSSTFVGVVHAEGLYLAANGGYLFVNASDTCSYTVDASGVAGTSVGLIHDTSAVHPANLTGTYTKIDGYRSADAHTQTNSTNKITSSSLTITNPSAGVVNVEATGIAAVTRPALSVTAQGLISENFTRALATTGSAPASQQLFAMLLGLIAGDIVTNVVVAVSTAAVGTAPTLIKLALCDKTGKVLGQTANLNSDSRWTSQGVKVCALDSPVTVPASDGYYVCLLQNGGFGSTNPQFAKQQAVSFTDVAGVGGGVPVVTSQAPQTDFQPDGSSQTFNTGTGNAFWVGCS